MQGLVHRGGGRSGAVARLALLLGGVGLALGAAACGGTGQPAAGRGAGIASTTVVTQPPSAVPMADPLSTQSLGAVDAQLGALDQQLSQADTDAASSRGDS